MSSPSLVAFRLGECGELFLRELRSLNHPSIHIHQRYRQSVSKTHQQPNPRWRRWTTHDGQSPTPYPGIQGLLQTFTQSQPTTVFIIAPNIHLHKLPQSFKLDAFEVADVLRKVRKERTPFRTVLLVDGVLEAEQLKLYDALFNADSAFQDVAARQLLLAHLRSVGDDKAKTASPVWAGDLLIDSGVHQEKPLSLPGFELCQNGPGSCTLFSEDQMKRLVGKNARIITTAGALLSCGSLLLASRPLELRFGPECDSATGSFCNNWISSRLSVLIQIDNVNLWCFWSCSSAVPYSSWRCHAMIIPHMDKITADAFDVAAFVGNNLTAGCKVTSVPDPVRHLPTFDVGLLLGQKALCASQEASVPTANAKISACATSSDQKDGIGGEEYTTPSGEMDWLPSEYARRESTTLDNISRPDRNFLKSYSKAHRTIAAVSRAVESKTDAFQTGPKKSTQPVPTKPQRAAPRTKSFLEIEDSSSLHGDSQTEKKAAQFERSTAQQEENVDFIPENTSASAATAVTRSARNAPLEKSSIALRRDRFSRLQFQRGNQIQTKRRQRGAETTLKAKPETTNKRRRSNYEVQRQHEVKRSRARYIESATNVVLNALETADPFFQYNLKDCENHIPAVSGLGKHCECIGVEVHSKHNEASYEERESSGVEFPTCGTHGVEYAHSKDNRDVLIKRFEQLHWKAGGEFKSVEETDKAVLASKLKTSVERLKIMGKSQVCSPCVYQNRNAAKESADEACSEPVGTDSDEAANQDTKSASPSLNEASALKMIKSLLNPLSESVALALLRSIPKQFPRLRNQLYVNSGESKD